MPIARTDGARVWDAIARACSHGWPRQMRPNVADAPVRGFVVGVIRPHLAPPTLSRFTRAHPSLARDIARWVRQTAPDAVFSSVQVNYNYASKKHVDRNNVGPSWICALGDFRGGALWTRDRGEIDVRGPSWTRFDGHVEHATCPFEGERVSFIAFTHRAYNRLNPADCDAARALGFAAAYSNSEEHPDLRGLAPPTQIVDPAAVARRDTLFARVIGGGGGGAYALSTGYNVGRGRALIRLPGEYAWSSARAPSFATLAHDGKRDATAVDVLPNRTGFLAFVVNTRAQTVSAERFDLYHRMERDASRMVAWLLAERASTDLALVLVSDTAVKQGGAIPSDALTRALRARFGDGAGTLTYRAPVVGAARGVQRAWATSTSGDVVALDLATWQARRASLRTSQ